MYLWTAIKLILNKLEKYLTGIIEFHLISSNKLETQLTVRTLNYLRTLALLSGLFEVL